MWQLMLLGPLESTLPGKGVYSWLRRLFKVLRLPIGFAVAPYSARDIAEYILEKQGRDLNAWTLQKLLYYCQAWSVTWDGGPLFGDKIEAWVDGPVCDSVWRANRDGTLRPGAVLSGLARETVDSVLAFYGQRPAGWLRALTHREAPWLDARRGLAPDQKSDREITTDALRTYYSKLGAAPRSFSRSLLAGLDTQVDTPETAPTLAADRVADGEGFLEWLRTGEGDPWQRSDD
jgi:uncharacterized phage-associated protein